MKYVYIIALLFCSNAFSSQAKQAGLNQSPEFGSYYMISDRTRFLNAAYISQTPNSIEASSLGEVDFKNGDYGISLGRKISDHKMLDAFYQFNENVGIQGFISGHNGKGVEAAGGSIGLTSGDFIDGYAGFQDVDKKLSIRFGGSVKALDGTLFADYKESRKDDNYHLTVGYGRVYKNLFGDLTYKQSKHKERFLAATIGGKVDISEKVEAFGAASQDIFFGDNTFINAGLGYSPVANLELTYSQSILAFSKASPKYSDFGFIVSAVYYL